MFRSANEINQIVKKAFISCGLSYAHSEDFGNASALLNSYGFDGLSSAFQAIQNIDLNKKISFSFLNNATIKFKFSRVSFEGFAAIDLLIANKFKFKKVKIERMDSPQMFLGLLAWNSYSQNCSFKLIFNSTKLNNVSINSTFSKINNNFLLPTNFFLTLENEEYKSMQPRFKQSKINSKIWSKLEKLAFKTYVPESKSSRETGAGAGLIDDD